MIRIKSFRLKNASDTLNLCFHHICAVTENGEHGYGAFMRSGQSYVRTA